jgi:hypothetical protein
VDVSKNSALVLAVAACLLVGLLAGCATTPAQSLLVLDDNPEAVLLVDNRRDNVELFAQVRGELTLIENTCFGMETEFGTRTVVFPEGTQVAKGGGGVTIPGLGTVMLGEGINGGGGTHSRANLDFYDLVPAKCQTDEISVLNSFDR